MDRRLRIAHALSATATLGVAAVAVATVDGGLFVEAAPAAGPGVKTIEIVDEYVVVSTAVAGLAASLAASVAGPTSTQAPLTMAFPAGDPPPAVAPEPGTDTTGANGDARSPQDDDRQRSAEASEPDSDAWDDPESDVDGHEDHDDDDGHDDDHSDDD